MWRTRRSKGSVASPIRLSGCAVPFSTTDFACLPAPVHVLLVCSALLCCVWCQLLIWLGVSLLMRVVRKSEGPVFTSPPPLPPALSALLQQPQVPLYYLYLSQICLYLDTKEVPMSTSTQPHRLTPLLCISRTAQ